MCTDWVCQWQVSHGALLETKTYMHHSLCFCFFSALWYKHIANTKNILDTPMRNSDMRKKCLCLSDLKRITTQKVRLRSNWTVVRETSHRVWWWNDHHPWSGETGRTVMSRSYWQNSNTLHEDQSEDLACIFRVAASVSQWTHAIYWYADHEASEVLSWGTEKWKELWIFSRLITGI